MNVMIKMWKKYNNQIIESKEFEANLKELKRHPPYEFVVLLKRIFYLNKLLLNKWMV